MQAFFGPWNSFKDHPGRGALDSVTIWVLGNAHTAALFMHILWVCFRFSNEVKFDMGKYTMSRTLDAAHFVLQQNGLRLKAAIVCLNGPRM